MNNYRGYIASIYIEDPFNIKFRKICMSVLVLYVDLTTLDGDTRKSAQYSEVNKPNS